MKKFKVFPKSIVPLIVLLLCITAQTAFSQSTSLNESPLPAPTEPVNDFAGVIDEATKQQLNQKIKDFKARTNPAVVLAVAVVKTTGERDIFEYSLSIARGWKIGSKEDDNPSALLFIAIDDRKYFTQVSKDLQDELPDGVVGQLQRQYLVPAFKQGDYGKGVADTIDAYMRTIEAKQGGIAAPTPIAAGQTKQQPQTNKSSFSICGSLPCLIILFIIMIALFSRAGRRKNKNDRNRWGGGGFGGGGGGILPWIIGSAVANSISNSSSGGWSNSGGSSSDWGGGSSGGSDWGGFGGGGDFDGGGSGGSW
ncbi:MAG TPA: TPM domain-containing protein [Pyrinomonadaceae bacterium]|jgi:uncharacterized protein